jgi:hypothetical protein
MVSRLSLNFRTFCRPVADVMEGLDREVRLAIRDNEKIKEGEFI